MLNEDSFIKKIIYFYNNFIFSIYFYSNCSLVIIQFHNNFICKNFNDINKRFSKMFEKECLRHIKLRLNLN